MQQTHERPPKTAPALLRMRNLSKHYGGLKAVGLSLDVRRGEILALVGDNGAGKPTLIKALSGAVVPDDVVAVTIKNIRENRIDWLNQLMSHGAIGVR